MFSKLDLNNKRGWGLSRMDPSHDEHHFHLFEGFQHTLRIVHLSATCLKYNSFKLALFGKKLNFVKWFLLSVFLFGKWFFQACFVWKIYSFKRTLFGKLVFQVYFVWEILLSSVLCFVNNSFRCTLFGKWFPQVYFVWQIIMSSVFCLGNTSVKCTMFGK